MFNNQHTSLLPCAHAHHSGAPDCKRSMLPDSCRDAWQLQPLLPRRLHPLLPSQPWPSSLQRPCCCCCMSTLPPACNRRLACCCRRCWRPPSQPRPACCPAPSAVHSVAALPLGSTAIARLVSCCPALEDLVFTPAADASLAPLQSLTALTRLNIGSVSPAVISSDLTALTQLRRLDVSVSLPAAGAGEDASSWAAAPGAPHGPHTPDLVRQSRSSFEVKQSESPKGTACMHSRAGAGICEVAARVPYSTF